MAWVQILALSHYLVFVKIKRDDTYKAFLENSWHEIRTPGKYLMVLCFKSQGADHDYISSQ